MAKPKDECTVTFEINKLKNGDSQKEIFQANNVQFEGEASMEKEAIGNVLEQWRIQMARMGIATA